MVALGMRFWVFSLAFLALQISSSTGEDGHLLIGLVHDTGNDAKGNAGGMGTVDEEKHLKGKARGTVVVDKKKLYELEVKPKRIVIQGLVYCQSSINLIPIEGAVAKVTCSAVKENGYESSPYTTMTNPTNKKGYFYTILPEPTKYGIKSLTQCKVTLQKSPLKTCSVPTNINNGLTGALLGSYHVLPNKHYLYSVGPFVYTPTPKPNNGKY